MIRYTNYNTTMRKNSIIDTEHMSNIHNDNTSENKVIRNQSNMNNNINRNNNMNTSMTNYIYTPLPQRDSATNESQNSNCIKITLEFTIYGNKINKGTSRHKTLPQKCNGNKIDIANTNIRKFESIKSSINNLFQHNKIMNYHQLGSTIKIKGCNKKSIFERFKKILPKIRSY